MKVSRGIQSIRSKLLLAAASAAAFLIAAPLAQASVRSTPSRTYVTNGPVYAVAPTANATYLGGSFTEVGPRTGPGVGIDSSTGKSTGSAQVNDGRIEAVVPDGSGGYYVGGDFSHVGGQTRHNLVHILANGKVDPDFRPDPNYGVRALAVSGSTVYAGGSFTRIGGEGRVNLAALNRTTGRASGWNPGSEPHQAVTALAVSNSTIYAAGGFHEIGGQARNGLAALDRTTGEATAWDPNPDDYISALAVSDSTVYVSGGFEEIGGEARNHIAALDATTGDATTWNPDATNSLAPCGSPGHPPYPIPRDCGTGAVTALAVTGSTVYAGGSFNQIGGETRNRLAALDRTTGQATAWDPSPRNGSSTGAEITTLAANGSTVYAGGWFTTIGGRARNNLAALSRTTGEATAWNPRPNTSRYTAATVYALAASGSTVYAGGTFRSIGVRTRNGIAAIDPTTGTATDWNPDANGVVTHLATLGATVWVGGWFDHIGGEDRMHLAGLNPTTGNATAFDPQPHVDAYITALAVSGEFVFIGGSVPGIAHQRAYFLTKVYKTDGRVRNSNEVWNANPNGAVMDLAFSGGRVYAAGGFTTIGGEARSGVAALDQDTADASDWDPNADGSVYALAIRNPASSTASTVYAGGQFTNIGGQSRNNLAALNGTTGQATAWNPDPDDTVNALALADSELYAGGRFRTIGGKARKNLAAIALTTGRATPWGPGVGSSVDYASETVNALALGPDNALWAAGGFTGFHTAPQAGIARFEPR
jgi:hypothetical protein